MAKTKARELRSDELIVAPLAELIRKRPRSELGHWVARHVLLGRPFTDDDIKALMEKPRRGTGGQRLQQDETAIGLEVLEGVCEAQAAGKPIGPVYKSVGLRHHMGPKQAQRYYDALMARLSPTDRPDTK